MNNDNAKKSKRVLMIAIIGIILMVFSLIFFVIKPIVKDVYKTRDGFEEDKIKFEIIKKDAAQSNIFVELVDNLGKDQKLVENALIKKDSIVIFIQDIESIAKEIGNKVNISQISTSKSSNAVASTETEEEKKKRLEDVAKEKNKVRLSLEISGNYKRFLEFLYKLENMTYIFEIESIEISNFSGRYNNELKASEEAPVDFTIGTIVLSFTPKENNNDKK